MDIEDIVAQIVDAALKIHIRLGPGLLESVYEALLAAELLRRGFLIERQKVIPFEFDGMIFEEGLTVDLLVNGVVVVELKSAQKFDPVHYKQVLTYLKLLDLRVGLLINFGAATLREGLKRVVNGYPSGAAKAIISHEATKNTEVRSHAETPVHSRKKISNKIPTREGG